MGNILASKRSSTCLDSEAHIYGRRPIGRVQRHLGGPRFLCLCATLSASTRFQCSSAQAWYATDPAADTKRSWVMAHSHAAGVGDRPRLSAEAAV